METKGGRGRGEEGGGRREGQGGGGEGGGTNPWFVVQFWFSKYQLTAQKYFLCAGICAPLVLVPLVKYHTLKEKEKGEEKNEKRKRNSYFSCIQMLAKFIFIVYTCMSSILSRTTLSVPSNPFICRAGVPSPPEM
jgi:hypothetical protein